MRRIAIASQKGGVGKTTLAVNLSVALGLMKKNVLLIDLDPQQSATLSLGVETDKGLEDIFLFDKKPDSVMRFADTYDLLPAGSGMTDLEIQWHYPDPESNITRLKKELDIQGYDFIFCDCPPNLGLLTENALVYCSEVIIPVKCDYLGLEALNKMIDSIEHVQSNFNPKLRITAIVPTFYDVRQTISDYVIDELKENYKKELSKTYIRVNVALAEAPAYGQSIFDYQVRSHGAQDIERLAKEIIKRGK